MKKLVYCLLTVLFVGVLPFSCCNSRGVKDYIITKIDIYPIGTFSNPIIYDSLFYDIDSVKLYLAYPGIETIADKASTVPSWSFSQSAYACSPRQSTARNRISELNIFAGNNFYYLGDSISKGDSITELFEITGGDQYGEYIPILGFLEKDRQLGSSPIIKLKNNPFFKTEIKLKIELKLNNELTTRTYDNLSLKVK